MKLIAKSAPLLASVFILLCSWLTVARADIAYSKTVGGPGGVPFEDQCQPGDFLVGFDYNAGKALNQIIGVCKAQRDGLLVGGEYRLVLHGTPAGASDGGQFAVADKVRCPENQVVKRLHVWWDKFGIVHHIRTTCYSLAVNVAGIYLTATVNAGGEPSHDDAAGCPSGMYAIGLIGGSGSLIDRVGLKCQEFARPVAAAPTPPAPAPVIKHTGVGPTSGTAIRDTDLYDAMEGNKIPDRFIHKGETVVIEFFGTPEGSEPLGLKGWCRIFGEGNPWIWAGDLQF